MVDPEALKPIREAIEKAAEPLNYATERLRSFEEVRRMRWRCLGCNYVKVFTRPMPAHVAPPCPKCKGDRFEPGEC